MNSVIVTFFLCLFTFLPGILRGENTERLGPCPDLLSHFSSSDRRLFYYKYYDEQTQPDKVIASLSRLNIFNDALNAANEIFNTDTVVTNYFERAAKISDGILTEPQFSSLIAELKNKIKAIQNLKPNNIPDEVIFVLIARCFEAQRAIEKSDKALIENMGNDSDAKEVMKLLFGVRRRLWDLAKAKGLTYTVVASSISQYYDLSVGSTYPELENSAHINHKYALTMLTVDKIKFGL